MSFDRVRNVLGFLFLWLLAEIFWTFILRGFLGQHPESAPIQGLAADTIA